ncbi:MAG: hypothetical protein ACRD0K_11380 [Egibacteraceae bacterium]
MAPIGSPLTGRSVATVAVAAFSRTGRDHGPPPNDDRADGEPSAVAVSTLYDVAFSRTASSWPPRAATGQTFQHT